VAERTRDLAHVGSVEMRSTDVDATVDFFVRLMGMSESGRGADYVYVHAWDDYERFTVKVTDSGTTGVGRTYLRAASAEALRRRVSVAQAAGMPGAWVEDESGLGAVYVIADGGGHEIGLYWDSERYQPDGDKRPALKNQAARFPGRGANVRRIDHVNYLAPHAQTCGDFVVDVLGGRLTEQIVLDSGEASGVWYSLSDKSYDLVYTSDWTGAAGRLHHVAFATDTREDILRAADVFLEAGIHIESGPHKHAIQQTFFLYVYEPAGNRIELCNAGARLLVQPDWEPVTWTQVERAKGQAWGMKTIESFHTYGTPPVQRRGETVR
jgi:catechol 2,3-dioxygenase